MSTEAEKLIAAKEKALGLGDYDNWNNQQIAELMKEYAAPQKELLSEVAKQLSQWAEQSKSGGWSTHQVGPQEKLAEKIFAHLGRLQD